MRWFAPLIALLLLELLPSFSRADIRPDWQTRVSPRLSVLWSAHKQRPIQPILRALKQSAGRARIDSVGRVQIDVFYDCSRAMPTLTLSHAGLLVEHSVHIPPMCVMEGWVKYADIPALASVTTVTHLDLPVYSRVIKPHSRSIPIISSTVSGFIDSAGISIMNSDQYIQSTNADGSGVTVGVMSDDVTSLAYVQSTGALPLSILVIPTSPSSGPTDEGTMMLEEIYAVAPGAGLAFCGPQTEVEYVSCLQSFASQHINIAVDDLEFIDDDMMSAQGTFAMAVAAVLDSDPSVTLFSSAGNENGGYWQGAYQPGAFSFNGASTLTCAANGQVDNYAQEFGTQNYDTLDLPDGLPGPLYLQWADPYGQNASDFDLYLLDSSFNVMLCIPGADSTETFDALLPPLPAGSYNLVIATPDASESGKFLKLLGFGDGVASLSVTTGGSVVSPQKFIPAVITVGAVDGGDGVGRMIEPFSATGPVQLEFPTPTVIQAPVLVAPDDVNVEIGGTYFPDSPFQGTSAAAPNAAAVAALLESTFTTLPPAFSIAALEKGAIKLGGATPNSVYGYGRVDAMSALDSIPSPTVSSISSRTIAIDANSGPIPFTVSGTGPLHVSAASDDAQLIGTGISITPAICGVTAVHCDIAISPKAAASGVAHITVQAKDSANRTGMSVFTVTVPAQPTPPSPPSGGEGQTGGGEDLGILGLGLFVWLRHKSRRRREGRRCM